MAAYHQMGHNCENLIGETDLDFAGVILSPVNRSPGEVIENIDKYNKKSGIDWVFDPQLYIPKSLQLKLKTHSYFPSDFDTADYSSLSWWTPICDKLINFVEHAKINSLVTPAILPKIFNNDYYNICNSINGYLNSIKIGTKLYLSVIVQHNQLTDLGNVYAIASSLTSVDGDGFYIVVESDIAPRYEFKDNEMLCGLMQLVFELKRTNKPVIVSNCSSDMILLKYAGATHCATGKYFNIRRFSKSRFNNEEMGGGQQAYFFADGLLAFIREADYLRLKRDKYDELITGFGIVSKWNTEIEKNFLANAPGPWVKYGWRQYMAWFSKAESIIGTNPNVVEEWLNIAENNWETVKNKQYFDEKTNNGSWIVGWKKALDSFKSRNNIS